MKTKTKQKSTMTIQKQLSEMTKITKQNMGVGMNQNQTIFPYYLRQHCHRRQRVQQLVQQHLQQQQQQRQQHHVSFISVSFF